MIDAIDSPFEPPSDANSAPLQRAPLYPKLGPWRTGLPTVVLVEDMDSIRKEWEYFVRQSGRPDSTVTHYKSASRAWPFILDNADDIDLVITDNQLSTRSMSGLGLIETIRGSAQTRHIPVIMITVTQDRNFRRSVIAAGVTGYFSKPVDKVMAPEIFAGLIHQSRCHRETRQGLKIALQSIGANMTTDQLLELKQKGGSQMVPRDQWQLMLSMAQAVQALGQQMGNLFIAPTAPETKDSGQSPLEP